MSAPLEPDEGKQTQLPSRKGSQIVQLTGMHWRFSPAACHAPSSTCAQASLIMQPDACALPQVEMVVVGDDCALPHSRLTGRRGIAGTLFVHKVGRSLCTHEQLHPSTKSAHLDKLVGVMPALTSHDLAIDRRILKGFDVSLCSRWLAQPLRPEAILQPCTRPRRPPRSVSAAWALPPAPARCQARRRQTRHGAAQPVRLALEA